jgi:soluble lytic murein transglycosylase-like protein
VIDLSTIAIRKSFVTTFAHKHLLDPVLVCAVCEQESDWNTWAVRFEPAFEARYIKPAIPEKPTTLEMTKAMSFGLMQIMGETAIEFGFTGRFLSELCDPEVGAEYGCRKLRRCLDLHAADLNVGLETYNGGSNPDYAAEVQARMARYF